jgi:hypothetical protein
VTTYPSRKRKEPTGMRQGRCPFPPPCEKCGDSGIIEFQIAWSPSEDAKLCALTTEGQGWPLIARALSRPVAVVRSRASLLWIRGPHEPDSYVIVRPASGSVSRSAP